MSTKLQFDVAIIGAGPAGLATAAVLKTINKDLKICVLDKHPHTTRGYGLSIAQDSIKDLQATLRQNLRPDNTEDHGEIAAFIQFLDGWKGRVVKTRKIEKKLTGIATRLGIQIIRKEAYREALTSSTIQHLLNKESPATNPVQQELKDYFQDTRLVIGAGGAHCPVRIGCMNGGDEEKRTHIKNLQYFIELKYQTNSETEKRNSSHVIKASTCEGIGFETLDKKNTGKPKPATIHFFVGENTYNAFHETNDKQTWNLKTLQKKALNNPIIENQALKIAHYLKGVIDRNGCCQEAKIKRLPITIYKAAEIVKIQDGRLITLVGDSLAGAVFARGINKAFKEASILAQVTSDFFKSKREISNTVPGEFLTYEKQVNVIFENERQQAEFKATWLIRGRIALRYILTPLKWIFKPVTFLYFFVKSYIHPEPTLGELIRKLEGKSR